MRAAAKSRLCVGVDRFVGPNTGVAVFDGHLHRLTDHLLNASTDAE